MTKQEMKAKRSKLYKKLNEKIQESISVSYRESSARRRREEADSKLHQVLNEKLEVDSECSKLRSEIAYLDHKIRYEKYDKENSNEQTSGNQIRCHARRRNDR